MNVWLVSDHKWIRKMTSAPVKDEHWELIIKIASLAYTQTLKTNRVMRDLESPVHLAYASQIKPHFIHHPVRFWTLSRCNFRAESEKVIEQMAWLVHEQESRGRPVQKPPHIMRPYRTSLPQRQTERCGQDRNEDAKTHRDCRLGSSAKHANKREEILTEGSGDENNPIT